MLTNLRNKFLLINMISLTVLIVISFFAVYCIIYNNINSSVSVTLNRTLSMHHPSFENISPPVDKAQPDAATTFSPKVEDSKSKHKRDLDDSRSFLVETDEKGNIATTSLFGENYALYSDAAERAAKKTKDTGIFSSNHIMWQYLVKPHVDGTRSIAVTDITAEYNILRSLIISLVFSALALMIITFFICLYFANKAIKPVKEAWDKQRQFIADASHELKTPLATINTNIDVLMSHAESTISEEQKWLGYVKCETERMTKLTNDLLYLARTENEDVKMIYENLSISSLCESSILTMEAVAFEKGIMLNYNIQSDVNISGNKAQLQQVMTILLDNAIKYSNPGGKINITLEKSGKDAVIRVKNTGAGIPDTDLEHIFDRFYRADKVRNRESGSYGLGLAIAKAIVTQHNGKISAESKLNEYTCFTVTVPTVK